MSDSPIKDAIDKLDTLPRSQGEIGAVVREGDFGAAGQIGIATGKGTYLAAAGEWMRVTGWSIAAKFGWKGKP
jgi:hypothetical protein